VDGKRHERHEIADRDMKMAMTNLLAFRYIAVLLTFSLAVKQEWVECFSTAFITKIGTNRHFQGQISVKGLNCAFRQTTGREAGQARQILLRSSKDSTAEVLINPSLSGKVCVVTGATRGIGKGIAIELGAAGAIVYVTGTSSRESKSNELDSLRAAYSTNEDVGGPGTIEETAELVTKAGGTGIPVLCNHANDDNVRALFKQIGSEQGRLDVLVNNAFRVPPGGADGLLGNFWEQGPEGWDAMHTIGLRSHYVATSLAVPLMLKTKTLLKDDEPKPLIAMISSYGGTVYTFNVAYGVGKAGVDRMAKDMHQELQSHGVAVCSLYPGVVKTERMDRVVESGEWEEKFGVPFNSAETPAFAGRAVAALAADPDNMSKSGTVQVVAELAREYNFFDNDLDDASSTSNPTRQPPSIRSLKFLIPNYALDKSIRDKVPDSLIPDWKIPMFIMAGGRPDPEAKV
jgi:dehydrogenase/reductase SDR family protein 1